VLFEQAIERAVWVFKDEQRDIHERVPVLSPAAGATVEPHDERGVGGVCFGRHHPIEKAALGRSIDGDIAAVHGVVSGEGVEAGKRRDAVGCRSRSVFAEADGSGRGGKKNGEKRQERDGPYHCYMYK
jgi:hypothetical protein